MKFGPVPIDEAAGKILAHNIPRSDGRRAIRKGKFLRTEDISALRREGFSRVYAAELEPGDVEENLAASQIAAASIGEGLYTQKASSGKVSIDAQYDGVFRVDQAALAHLNACDGIAFATVRSFASIKKGQTVATVKVIPYALPSDAFTGIVQAARRADPLLQARELTARKVTLLVMGFPAVEKKLFDTYTPPLQKRVESAGSTIVGQDFVQLTGLDDDVALAEALNRQTAQATDLIILISETSTMDANDIAPRGIRLAEGEVACVGAPVDPGNLLMIAYLGRTPILGVPGCARSPKSNIVDLILPALLSGIRITRSDIAQLGHGGFLEE